MIEPKKKKKKKRDKQKCIFSYLVVAVQKRVGIGKAKVIQDICPKPSLAF